MSPTVRLRSFAALTLATLGCTAIGCSEDADQSEAGSAEANQSAWVAPAEDSCEAKAMQTIANEATRGELETNANLERAAAEAILAGRPFTSVRQIDDVPRVGPAALSGILELARAKGLLAACGAAPSSSEIGVVSDLDKTVIPESEPDMSEAPYPGVKALIRLLETRNNGAAGDVYYVTARTPESAAGVPDYLAQHDIPNGQLDTGTSGVPWVAQAEKIRDIERILGRTGTQRFVFLGDSSHRDPEVYKAIAQDHPERVIATFIHKVNATVSPGRVEGQYLHSGYAEVAAILYGLQVITRAEARSVMDAAHDEGLAITSAQMDALLDEHRP